MAQPKVDTLQIDLSEPVDFLNDVTIAGTLTVNGDSIFQDLFSTITADTGSVVASSSSDSLSIISGTDGLATSISGNTLTISAPEDIFSTVNADAGSVTATSSTDTLTITGTGGVTTAVVGGAIVVDTVDGFFGGAGDGLTTSIVGSPEELLLNVVAGDGITVSGSPDFVAVDTTVIRTSGTQAITGTLTLNGSDVLTEADFGSPITSGSSNFVAGDGIEIGAGSPETIDVDSTVVRESDNPASLTSVSIGEGQTISDSDNVALLDQSNTFTADNLTLNTTGGALDGFIVSGSNARLFFDEDDQSTDARKFSFAGVVGELRLRSVDDSGTLQQEVFRAQRSGTIDFPSGASMGQGQTISDSDNVALLDVANTFTNVNIFQSETRHNTGGTQSNPQITFAGDTDTGLYRNTADNLSISVGSNRAMNIAPGTVVEIDDALSIGGGQTISDSDNIALTTGPVTFDSFAAIAAPTGAVTGNDVTLTSEQGSNWSQLRLQDFSGAADGGALIRTSTDSGSTWTTVFQALGSGVSWGGGQTISDSDNIALLDAANEFTGPIRSINNSSSLEVVGDFYNSNDNGGAEFRVRGDGQGDGYLYVGQTEQHGGGIMYRGDGTSPKALTNDPGNDNVVFYRRSATTDHAVMWCFHSSSNVNFAGNVTAAGDVTGNSDIRLKSNLKRIDNALNKVDQLTGYTFDKEDSERRHAGLIAQEIEDVLPEVVHENDGIKSIAYGNVTSLLVEAIKELRCEIKELKNDTTN